MLSEGYSRHYSFFKATPSSSQWTSNAVSSDTTTSSGYSTGGSSVATTLITSSNERKVKAKGLHHFLSKLKTLIIPPRSKQAPLQSSREMSSTTTLRQYSTTYDLPLPTSHTVSLPFTYLSKSPVRTEYNRRTDSYVTKSTNFEKISAWLSDTDRVASEECHVNTNNFLFMDEQPLSATPTEVMMMKKSPSINKIPKRSTSMVATLTRPIIEKREKQRAPSPTSSFSSSILTRGMTEQMTPQKTYHPVHTNVSRESTDNLVSKTNRRRAIDFSRRRTVAGPTEQMTNKENSLNNGRQPVYRFSPSTSTNTASKTYYFHTELPVKNEDILMNSYGLILHQQQQQQARQSIATVTKRTPNLEKFVRHSPARQLTRRLSTHLTPRVYTSEALDDLLCDQEVESYFYPNRNLPFTSLPAHISINLETPLGSYQPIPPPPAYMQGTLC